MVLFLVQRFMKPGISASPLTQEWQLTIDILYIFSYNKNNKGRYLNDSPDRSC